MDYGVYEIGGSSNLASPSTFGFDYYASGELKTLQHPSGLSTAYAYEANGPIRQIQVSGTAGTLAQFDYSYDANNNVDLLSTLAGQHDYDYDGLNRLTQALHPAATGLPGQEDFGYDQVGNREDPADTSAYDYDANNRIQQSPARSYSFDDDGNMLSRATVRPLSTTRTTVWSGSRMAPPPSPTPMTPTVGGF